MRPDSGFGPKNGNGSNGDSGSKNDVDLDGNGVNAEFFNFAVYYFKYTYREDDIPWAASMIVLCLILIVTCFFFNGIVANFYRKKASEVVSLIYLLLSLADIFVCVGSCLTVVCLVLYIGLDMEDKECDYVYPAVKYLCFVTFFISSIAIRFSIFLNVILTVVRTIMIKDPFREISKTGIFVALGTFTVFWMTMSAGEVYTLKTVSIDMHWDGFLDDLGLDPGDCAVGEEEGEENRKQNLYYWFYIFTTLSGYYCTVETLSEQVPWSFNWIPKNTEGFITYDELEIYAAYAMLLLAFIIPTMVAVICLVLQTISLSKAQITGVPNSNKEVTVTIILLTLVFVFCNIITITFALVIAYTDVIAIHENGDVVIKDDSTIKSLYRLLFFFQQVLPLLNSTLSPVILIWRGTALRNHLKSFLFSGRGDTNSTRISRISCAVLQPT